MKRQTLPFPGSLSTRIRPNLRAELGLDRYSNYGCGRAARTYSRSIAAAVFIDALRSLLRGQSPELVRTAWFVLLGRSSLLVLFPVRTRRPFWQAPSPSAMLAIALGGALLVIVGLVNVPSAQALLGFVPLAWPIQRALLAYGGLCMLVADVLKLAYHHSLQPPELSRGADASRRGTQRGR